MAVFDRSLDLGPYIEEPGDGMLVCRCEEVSRGDIRKAIHEGMYTMTELRRWTRCGMGLCQGRTCGRIIKGILASELGCRVSDLEDYTPRGPARPVSMGEFGNEVEPDE
ncbi:MAG: (2Fe-2S)-binding protein [Atopobiaceae bacterium]|nr:(2Fe-2S)-binding protein [Atopobiaceae bacterium]